MARLCGSQPARGWHDRPSQCTRQSGYMPISQRLNIISLTTMLHTTLSFNQSLNHAVCTVCYLQRAIQPSLTYLIKVQPSVAGAQVRGRKASRWPK